MLFKYFTKMSRYRGSKKIGGVSAIDQNLKSYVNSMCHGKRIRVAYFLNMIYIISDYLKQD